MAIREPQFDLSSRISGGADVWDDGLGGELLTADYFDASAPPSSTGSHIKAWSGSAWVSGELKRWDSSTWQPATLQRWNGSSWVPVP